MSLSFENNRDIRAVIAAIGKRNPPGVNRRACISYALGAAE
jgi:hypothetical protein